MTTRYSLEDGPVRQGLTAVDPDVTDYYDDEGLPAPHRLSDIHSTSPYPAFPSQESFPLTNTRHSLSQDPFRTSFDTMNAKDQGYNYGAGAGAGYGSPYGSVPNHDDDFARPSGDDAWGVPASASGESYNNARDRYVARKEAGSSGYAAGASGAMAGYGKPTKSRMWWWVGGLMGIIVLAGIIAGVVVATRKNGSSASSSKTGPAFTGNDPSQFEKNSTYKQSFFGLAYSPIGSQLSEGCSNTIDSVIYDLQVISQLTTHIRGYGADCNQTAQTLQAIHDTKVNMTYWPGIYLSADADPTQEEVYERQVANLTEAIKEYGTDRIGGVIVGNEYLLNDGTVTGLLSFVQKFRDTAATNGWTFKIGTGDAASKFSPQLGAGIDFFMANNHPWFAEVSVQDAPGWTWNYFQESGVSVAATLPNNPDMYIGEVGWPSKANATAFATLGNAVASNENLQYFIDNFACQSTKNGTLSFFFEAYDEKWKDIAFGGVEGYWGLFDENKRLKDGISFPDCN